MNWKVPRFAIWLVLLMCGGLYLVGNARVALWDRDEPRYAMASRWMAQTGDWVVPRIGWGLEPATPRTKKPVMTYWCQASVMRLVGPTVFAARLPSSLATITLLAVLSWLVTRYRSRAHAFWMVFILGTSAMLVIASKMCVTDTILLLFVTIAQFCLLAIYRGARAWWVPVVMWLAVGLGGLTKGPVILGVQLMTMLTLAVIDGFRRRAGVKDALRWWLRIRPIMGLVILLVVCGPWLYLVQHRDPTFLTQAVSHDVIERMKTGLEDHSGYPGYYLATIFGTFFPWSMLLPLAFVVAARRMRQPNVRFALAAVIGPWIMMEAVQTKLVHYVLPIFPPLAYLTAEAVLWCLRGRHDGLINRTALLGSKLWAGLVVVVACTPWVLLRLHQPTPVVPMVALALMSGLGLAMAIGTWAGFANRRPARALLAMGVGFAAVVAVTFGCFLPKADFLRLPIRIAADLVARGATQPGEVLMTDYKEQSVAFYQGGTIDAVWENFLDTHEVSAWPEWMVLTPRIVEDLPPGKAGVLEEVSRFNGFNYATGRWVDVLVMRKRAGAK
ncbi:MAG TPA: glycosyltransferase family 39 protein [Tepidisphaeraceae bacterium]|jgi:4-amino-4-deoxy-L-arabinose transferase-like glycosyltransferase|nr:glycosyltransferase family 39 protein [Tepidisphaeraceae bacterium]